MWEISLETFSNIKEKRMIESDDMDELIAEIRSLFNTYRVIKITNLNKIKNEINLSSIII